MSSVLGLLLQAYPQAVSGEEMAQQLQLSRTAIWKKVQLLLEQGLEISGRQHQGYRLLTWPDRLLPELLQHYRRAAELGRLVDYHPSVDSTNTRAKELARLGAVHGTLVVAEEQTAGRGRRGRDWLSPPHSGIFASVILRPELPADRLPLLTLAAGVALVQALHACGLPQAWLKWPNDVWVGSRKLAGVLAELSGQADQLDWVVVGMGVNTRQQAFPAELAERATSFLRETGAPVNRAELLAVTLYHLEQLLQLAVEPDRILNAWQQYDRLIGREVEVIAADESFRGQAVGLAPNGALLVCRADGRQQAVLAGDVSLRPAGKIKTGGE